MIPSAPMTLAERLHRDLRLFREELALERAEACGRTWITYPWQSEPLFSPFSPLERDRPAWVAMKPKPAPVVYLSRTFDPAMSVETVTLQRKVFRYGRGPMHYVFVADGDERPLAALRLFSFATRLINLIAKAIPDRDLIP